MRIYITQMLSLFSHQTINMLRHSLMLSGFTLLSFSLLTNLMLVMQVNKKKDSCSKK